MLTNIPANLKENRAYGREQYAHNKIINDIFKKGGLIAVESDVLSIYIVV